MNILDSRFGFALNENGVCDCHPLLTMPDNPAMVSSCHLDIYTQPKLLATYSINDSGNLTEIIARSYCCFGFCELKTITK